MTVEALAVGLGVVVAAAIGTALRHWATGRFNQALPLGTLGVNLAASFLLGLVSGLDDPAPLIVGLGGLGALSTWSTVANEVAEMARGDEPGLAVGYLGLTVSTGVLSAWFGLTLGPLLI